MTFPSDFRQGDGVLLVGHGTRDEVGTAQFFELAKKVAQRLPGIPVAPGLLELQRPTISDAWGDLMESSVTRVLVAPLLLFAAGHARSDIPAAISACLAATGDRDGIRYHQARPLSRAPELLSLVLKRLDEVNSNSADVRRTGVVMVGRGSHDPCAQTDMKLLSHWVAGQRPFATVATCFYAMAHPSLQVTIERLLVERRLDTIIVQPHLLFDGKLFQSIAQIVARFAEGHPNKRFALAPYLGPEGEIADSIVRRITQSIEVSGDP